MVNKSFLILCVDNNVGILHIARMKAITFTTTQGQTLSFETYLDFSTWFFGISRRVMLTLVDAPTFKRLNRYACYSREARQPLSRI